MRKPFLSDPTLAGVPLTITVENESVNFVYKGGLVLLGSFLHCVPADSIRLRRATKRITGLATTNVYLPHLSQPASRYGEIAELPSGGTFGCVAQVARSEERKRSAGRKTDLPTSLTPCFAHDPSSLDCLSPAANLADSPKARTGQYQHSNFLSDCHSLSQLYISVMGSYGCAPADLTMYSRAGESLRG